MLRFSLARCSIVSKLPDTANVKARLTTEFHRNVFAAVIQSFELYDNPLRVNDFATGLRELTRLVLDYNAPEKSIKACAWYVEEKNEQGKVVITRAQRIKYAVQAGLPDDFVTSVGPGRWSGQSGKELVLAEAFLHPETERRATEVSRFGSGVWLERRSLAWLQVPCAEQWLTVGAAQLIPFGRVSSIAQLGRCLQLRKRATSEKDTGR